uniref:Predicted protein n=1 Tax=Hordeum vulgare subsp. vulgare TaxID=112509 RepID=F2EAU3_HORVV|nr:predicted protein [Hordeum vulgare subsp. vulgare]
MAAKGEASIAGQLLAVALVVVAAASSSAPVAGGDAKAAPACLNEYSKLCGKDDKKDAACASMVDKACGTEASSVAFIERLFAELATVGQKKRESNTQATSGGQDALNGSIDKHGGCPGNKTVYTFSSQCAVDCDTACTDPTCSDRCYIDCPYIAARFGYIMATPANKKAIGEDMDCFKRCAKEKDATNDKCLVACKLLPSSLAPTPAKAS